MIVHSRSSFVTLLFNRNELSPREACCCVTKSSCLLWCHIVSWTFIFIGLAVLSISISHPVSARNLFFHFARTFFWILKNISLFCVATDIPVWTSGDSLGFKTRLDLLLVCFLCLHTMDSSDSHLEWHSLTSWQPAWQLSLFDPHTCKHVYKHWWSSDPWPLVGQPSALNHSVTPARLC